MSKQVVFEEKGTIDIQQQKVSQILKIKAKGLDLEIDNLSSLTRKPIDYSKLDSSGTIPTLNKFLQTLNCPYHNESISQICTLPGCTYRNCLFCTKCLV